MELLPEEMPFHICLQIVMHGVLWQPSLYPHIAGDAVSSHSQEAASGALYRVLIIYIHIIMYLYNM
jgi:hypothetical protein